MSLMLLNLPCGHRPTTNSQRPTSYICRMDQLIQQIEGYKQEIEQLQVEDPKALEDYRIRFLGSKGIVKNLFGELRNIPSEQKKSFGQALNDFRQFAESKYEEWKQT